MYGCYSSYLVSDFLSRFLIDMLHRFILRATPGRNCGMKWPKRPNEGKEEKKKFIVFASISRCVQLINIWLVYVYPENKASILWGQKGNKRKEGGREKFLSILIFCPFHDFFSPSRPELRYPSRL